MSAWWSLPGPGDAATWGGRSPDRSPHKLIAQEMETFGPSPELDEALATCHDAECAECSRIVCPHGDPMHFHHDGCPSCAIGEQQ